MLHRDEDGTLPSYAWPGGYPVVYYTEDSAILCPDCANGRGSSYAYTGKPEDGIPDPQWHVVAQEVYWEGPTVNCDHCNADIESAYGDPDEDAVQS